jgi:hypothetical protein
MRQGESSISGRGRGPLFLGQSSTGGHGRGPLFVGQSTTGERGRGMVLHLDVDMVLQLDVEFSHQEVELKLQVDRVLVGGGRC